MPASTMLMSDADNAKNTMRSDTIPRIHNNDPTTDSRMMQSTVIRTISVFATIVGCAISYVFSNAQEPSPAKEQPSEISPDKKWEYKAATKDHGPQIVKAGTDEAAGDLSDDCDIGSCGDSANVQWAPDSKRFAFDWGQGRAHLSSFYQLRNDHWEPVKPAPGKEASEHAQRDIEAQLKRKGLSTEKLEKKGLYLRYISSEEKLDRWIDANTALLYAGLRKVIAKREEPGEMSDGFGADFLFTLKFDDAGDWKIVKTRQMSKKELDQEQ